jgi:cytochrome c biogenesis protein CcmG, thiol:disulfide interchange protein DsbE
MRNYVFTAFILLNAVIATHADEKFAVLKIGSDVYSNVTVTTLTATDIYFTYDGGMANAKLKNLSPELQKHFHYNATKASQVEQKQAADNTQYHLQVIGQTSSRSQSADNGGGGQSSSDRQEPETGKQLWAKSFLNQKAPDLIVEKWLTAEPDRRGKFTLIDFWATWCPPCRKAIPELNGYYEKFSDKLVVIGISDETEEAVRKLVNPQIEYSIAIDTQARTKNVVGVTGIPHVLIIDPQGIVRWEGFPFLQGYELNEKVVADILAKYSN